MGLFDRLKHAWNAFNQEDEIPSGPRFANLGLASSYRPDRVYFSRGTERSIISAIYTRISMDCSSIGLRHVRVDDNGRYIEDIKSGLNYCLSTETNKDQISKAFVQDIVLSMFDEGCVAIVPVDTSMDPLYTNSYDIHTMRVGRIIQWYPDNVQVEVYNDKTGIKENLTLPKSMVAIIENPFYSIMNERNSILQRLIRKLNILDAIDEQSGAGKLDLIIQLPYVIKTDARRQQAELRRKDIEDQLSGSKYGIAYTDGTEKVMQLNRPVENNLMSQIEFLTSMLYSQLGITQSILDGTADEKTMINYMNRTIEPIMSSIVDGMKVKFLTKTARSQHQTIMYFTNPFKLVTVNNLAEIADRFTRNEIMSSNEVRQLIGLKPVDDPTADELRNKNLNRADQGHVATTDETFEFEEQTNEEGG